VDSFIHIKLCKYAIIYFIVILVQIVMLYIAHNVEKQESYFNDSLIAPRVKVHYYVPHALYICSIHFAISNAPYIFTLHTLFNHYFRKFKFYFDSSSIFWYFETCVIYC